ncbi:hypothetical protein K3495_g8849 [Podosphaera aphanis]|nr:hypothetical protein K3495_g8849 [Podosphaera aphanis]
MPPPPPSQTSKEIEQQFNTPSSSSIFSRVLQTFVTFLRHHLLQRCLPSIFGHASRLQVLILATLLGYLLIFSLVGIVYQSWITPIASLPGVYNTRTGFAGFADRVGVFAFALTPLTVLLSTRQSVLMLITGISYQHFNFLHRWIGRIIFIQALIHSVGWTIIKAYLYQPQPIVYREFMAQTYIIWGVVAMVLLFSLYILSFTRSIKTTGYEFFYISHVILALMYIAACWNHWAPIRCWMIASLIVVLLDLLARKVHLLLLHFQFIGKEKRFVAAQATVRSFHDPNGTVIRLDFEHSHSAWKPGQHFFLTFPSISIWQAHPFTVLASPQPTSYVQRHSYIIRSRSGETSKLSSLASQLAAGQKIPVILTGPYGTRDQSPHRPNILAITGGTGISFALPKLLHAASCSHNGLLELVWIIRRINNFDWVVPEIEALKVYPQIKVRILVTGGSERDAEQELSSYLDSTEKFVAMRKDGESDSVSLTPLIKSFEVSCLNGRPDVRELIIEYLDRVERGRVLIVGSGPQELGASLREVVASVNLAGKVWRGDSRADVGFYWDY